MPEPIEVVILFLVGLAARVAWRYVERGLERLEAHAGKNIPRFGLPFLHAITGNPYLLVLPLALGLVIWSAVKGYWTTVGVGFGGFTAGFLLAHAQRRRWIPEGTEHVVLGLLLLSLAGLAPAQMALEVSPWWGFAAIGIAPAGIVELWRGVQMIRAKVA